jgi:hypothetical protein
MWNTAGASARVLEIVAPAGLEDYFEELERTYGVKL